MIKDSVIKISTKSIKKFGEIIEINRRQREAYTPEDGIVEGNMSVFKIPAIREAYTPKEIDGTVVQQGDIRFVIPETDGYKPHKSDMVMVGGLKCPIIDFTPISLQGGSVAYYIQVRKHGRP